MEKDIKVSILCTAYNHEKFIAKCLDGLLMQKTDFPYEILINDDASTDNTANVIREYEKKYKDVVKPIYQTENQYSKDKEIFKNILLPKASGKYIALCEGDDYWIDENKLQAQYDALENNPNCHMCVHKVGIVDENCNHLNKYFPRTEVKEGVLNTVESLEMDYAQTCSYFFNGDDFRKFYKEFPYFAQISPVGDRVFMLYFSNLGDMYYIDKEMSHYRSGTVGGWTTLYARSDKTRISMIKMFQEFNKYSDYKYRELIDRKIFEEYKGWCYSNASTKQLNKEYKPLYNKLNSKLKWKVFFGGLCPPLVNFRDNRVKKRLAKKRAKEKK